MHCMLSHACLSYTHTYIYTYIHTHDERDRTVQPGGAIPVAQAVEAGAYMDPNDPSRVLVSSQAQPPMVGGWVGG